MKNTLLFLTVVGGLVLPAVTHADSPVSKDKKSAKACPACKVAAAQPAKKEHVVYYISDTTRTGSAIPMVYRKYDGHIDSASNAAVYGQTDIQHTGALDVSTALSQLDTSITVGRRRG